MQSLKLLFLSLAWLLLPQLSQALRFDQPEINDGFGNRTIWAMAQDHNKYIWLATTQNVLRYDGYAFQAIEINEQVRYKKRTVHVDQGNRLWIGTGLGELYSQANGRLTSHGTLGGTANSAQAGKPWAIHQITSINDTVYLATQNGLYSHRIGTHEFTPFEGIEGAVRSAWVKDAETLYITLGNALLQLNPRSHARRIVHSFAADEMPRVLHPADEGAVFVGTNRHLYRVDTADGATTQVAGLPEDTILSLSADDRHVWIGSLTQGLFLLNRRSGEITQHRHQPNTVGALSDDVIMSMLLEPSGAVFLGTFDGNLNTTHTLRLQFGAISGTPHRLDCIKSNVIYHVFEDARRDLWLSTANGVVHLGPTACTHHAAGDAENTLSYPEIRSISQADEQTLWVATNQGLNRLNIADGAVDRLSGVAPVIPTVFAVNKGPDAVLVGSEAGLFSYHPSAAQFERLSASESGFADTTYFAHSFSHQTQLDYFATDRGVVQLKNNTIQPLQSINQHLRGAAIGDVHINPADGAFFISTTENGLYHFDREQNLLNHWRPGHELPERSQLLDILQDHFGNLWVSSRYGLFRFKANTEDVQVFYAEQGLQDNTFKRGASFQAFDDKLYFGGLKGLNAFYPQNIPYENAPPAVHLTQFQLFNQMADPSLKAGDELASKDIDALDRIALSHRDDVFGFAFAAVDYTAAGRLKYAHKLHGLDPDWNIINAQNRHVAYTSLDPGTYTLMLKASTPSGHWGDAVKRLEIVIHPAPWFSWWAYTLYVLLGLTLLLLFIRYKLRKQRAMSIELQQQVDQQTHQIKQQKDALQVLVSKKNELFSNVTHEFRTPLTLILGPVDQLLNHAELGAHHPALNLIHRNASKLLKLVDQLMLLARTNEHNAPVKSIQNVQTVVPSLLTTFEHAAREKDIALILTRLDAGSVRVSEDALEIILGNLLSNAIKYTQAAGQVEVSVTQRGEQLEFKVKDNGPGIPADRLESVFERFTRLQNSQTIEGVGIGLALAQAVAKANNSRIAVSSEAGHGSVFRFLLPLCQGPALGAIAPLKPDRQHAPAPHTTQQHAPKEKPALLIIEDNKDMQAHLLSELTGQFSCEIADDGHAGITAACQSIPDIILCDVMMPKMDGFEVSRMIRNNPLTCHIPLVLLTALNDRSYRIKGWRDGVDLFLTKPFDAAELRMQLHNILNIRAIINCKNQRHFLDHPEQQELPQVDAQFVQKFKHCVAEHYPDPKLNVNQMARMLCVSERQLQRKCKSLLELTPIELLREWRVKMAAQFLLEGHQVAWVADRCGFNSLSYFSHSFKSKYGLSPKQYQQQGALKTRIE